MRRLAMLAALLLSACGSSDDLVLRDTFDPNRPDPTTATGSTDTETTDPGPQNCIWVGEYELAGARCGDVSYGDWGQVYDATTLSITHNLEDGCDLALTLSNADCSMGLAFWADPAAEDTSVTFKDPPQLGGPFGVFECDPEECRFTPGSPPCTLGDHASEQVVLVDQTQPDALILNFFIEWAAPTCAEGLRLTFAKDGAAPGTSSP